MRQRNAIHPCAAVRYGFAQQHLTKLSIYVHLLTAEGPTWSNPIEVAMRSRPAGIRSTHPWNIF